MTRDDHQAVTAVQVALRIRPLSDRDRSQPRFNNLAQDDVLQIVDKTVRVAQHNKQFTFDYVFGADSRQSDVFSTVGRSLIHKFLEGYNVTILAYGQTSSGKTYTMGTAQHEGHTDSEQDGIVPRAMALLFDTLASRKSESVTPNPAPDASVKVSFIELYNEEVKDLLNSAPPSERAPVLIREDTKGQIYWANVKEVPVHNTDQVLSYLERGTLNRATGATDMNEQSSRSHAIFSVSLQQKTWIPHSGGEPDQKTRPKSVPALPSAHGDWLVTTSKFHFVDLAGSERLKRTAAEGDRRKEGININSGLLALGNVISALGDPSKRSTHVPYRDSKLTRLLQDSLGGNATTLMIACVSPVEYNLSETLNTLQYANRARNIKNKAERNEIEEWMTTDNLELLRSMIAPLKAEIRRLKHKTVTPPPSISDRDSPASPTPTRNGSSSENERLCHEQRFKIINLQRQLENLHREASVTQERNVLLEEELERRHKPASAGRRTTMENFPHLVEPVIEEYEKSFSAFESQLSLTRAALNHSDEAVRKHSEKLEKYERQIENQKKTIVELRQRVAELVDQNQHDNTYIEELENRLMSSVDEMVKDRKLLAELKHRIAELKETDESTEQYIITLEKRLADSDAARASLEAAVEDLEAKVAEKHEERKSEHTSTDDVDTLREFDEQIPVLNEKDSQKRCDSEPDQYEEEKKYEETKEMRTLNSMSTLDMEDIDDRTAEEGPRVTFLEEQLALHKKMHEATLKDLEDTSLQYQEALGQVKMLKESTSRFYEENPHHFESLGHSMSETRNDAYEAEREANLYQIDVLQQTIADLQGQLADAIGHAAVHESNIRELKATVSSLKQNSNNVQPGQPVRKDSSPDREIAEKERWDQLTDLEEVRNELEQKLVAATTLCDRKQSLIETLTVEKERAFEEIHRLHEQVEENERELEYTHEELEALDCALKFAQEEGAKLRQEKSEATLNNAKNDQAHQQGSTWERDTIQRLQDELTELEEQLLNKDDTIHALEDLSSQFNAEKEQIVKRLQKAEADANQEIYFQEKAKELEDKLENLITENGSLLERVQEMETRTIEDAAIESATPQQEAEQQIEALDVMLQTSSLEKKRLESELKATTRVTEELLQKIEVLTGSVQTAAEKQSRLEAEKHTIEAEIQRLERAVDLRDERIVEEQRAKEESLVVIRQLEATKERLVGDLSLAQIANQEKDADLVELQRKVEMQSAAAELEGTLQHSHSPNDDTIDYIDSAKALEQERVRISELEANIEALQKDNEHYLRIADNLANDLEKSEENMQVAKNKVAALEEKLLIKAKEAHMSKLIEDMVPQTVVDTLQEELQKRDTEITKAQEKFKRLQGEKLDMLKKYEAQSKALAAVQADFKELKIVFAENCQSEAGIANDNLPTRGASLKPGTENQTKSPHAVQHEAVSVEKQVQPLPSTHKLEQTPTTRVGDKDLQNVTGMADDRVTRLQQELDAMGVRLQERERKHLAAIDQWKIKMTAMELVDQEKQALENELLLEKDRSAKVQKALEDQIEMLLSKKNKFICF